MFNLIEQVLIALLSFNWSLATKSISLNNKKCMIRTTFIDLYPPELNYYQFMISLGKCSWSCNSVDNLSTKNMHSK